MHNSLKLLFAILFCLICCHQQLQEMAVLKLFLLLRSILFTFPCSQYQRVKSLEGIRFLNRHICMLIWRILLQLWMSFLQRCMYARFRWACFSCLWIFVCYFINSFSFLLRKGLFLLKQTSENIEFPTLLCITLFFFFGAILASTAVRGVFSSCSVQA